ncbi:polysaccharide biosynthesis/export family protein [Sphingomonas daechungensis]
MEYLHPRGIAGGRSGFVVASALLLALGACTSLGSAGPSASSIKGANGDQVGAADIKVVDVTDNVARQVLASSRSTLFSEALGDVPPAGTIVGPGDVLEVTVWEAPPAVLFGSSANFGSESSSSVLAAATGVGQRTPMPEMMVDRDGMIHFPFAGAIRASGRTPHDIEREIENRLARKAHDPQVAVRLVTNASANVTVVGEVAKNARVPLTPRGERLLDIVASAGGVKQPVGKMTIRITRGDRVVSLPLETIIHDPAQNVRLQSDDVVTALYQPFSFTSLGATGKSSEVEFEATGITLSQALGRAGGLRDDRADIRGVFIFRLEDPAALDPGVAATARRTPDGLIPVIYRVNLSDPKSFFVAQTFPIRNKDVLYVSTAPLSDFQRFVSIVSSLAFTALGLGQAIP